MAWEIKEDESLDIHYLVSLLRDILKVCFYRLEWVY